MTTAPRPWVLILAGGSGTRFWPASRPEEPKHVLPLLAGGQTLLEATLQRAEAITERDRIRIVTSPPQTEAISALWGDRDPAHLIIEPEARNTAPALLLGMAYLGLAGAGAHDPVVVLPADALVDDDTLFAADLEHAISVSRAEKAIVTVGIQPTHPSTGYGYLGLENQDLEVEGTDPNLSIRKVLQFKEKPSADLAREYHASDKWWWNAGIFVFRFGYMVYVSGDVDERFDVLMTFLACLQQDDPKGLAVEYSRLPAISVDHGIMELAPEVRAVPARFGWSDLGSWDAMQAVFQPGPGGVSRAGKLVAEEAADNIVYAPGKSVALLGVSNLVVVATEHGVLVLPKERAQEVRSLVTKLAAATGSA